MEDIIIIRTDGIGEHMRKKIMTLAGSEQAISKQKIDESQSQELLPGIPDGLTIDRILTKLPWTAFPILASVSRGWRRAFRSRQVYDARVLSNSAQTLVALIHSPRNSVDKKIDTSTIEDGPNDIQHRIALYSLEDGSRDHLPPIPGVKEGIPESCGCVSMDGKLYILGGSRDGRFTMGGRGKARSVGVPARSDVYVFDVAGDRQWKECAQMENPRELFGCAAKDGKIFVFGGSSDCRPVSGSELYDPDADSWSPITPVPSLRFSHKVSTMGEELVLHGGSFYNSEFFEGNRNRVIDFDDPLSPHMQYAVSAEVYHPLTDEWRTMEHFTRNRNILDLVVMVGGKFVNLKPSGLQVYDIHANSWEPEEPAIMYLWKPKYRISTPKHSFEVMLTALAAIALDDEVLALVLCRDLDDEATRGPIWIKSQGLGGEIEEIIWRKVPYPFPSSFVGTVKL